MKRASAALTIIACLAAYATHDPADPSAPVIHSVTVNGAQLSYVDQGQGSPVLLVHGAFRDYRSWGTFMRDAARTHRVIAYSRRNYYPNPLSDVPPESVGQTDTADLIALIEALELPAVHLVGHSMGGMVALSVAAKRPDLVRSLTLEEGGFVSDGPATQASFAELAGRSTELLNDIRAGQLTAATRKFNDAVIGEGAYAQASAEQQRSWLDNVFTLLLPRGASPMACDSIKAMKVPTLVTLGDRTVPFVLEAMEETLACLMNEEVVTISDATHDVHVSNPKAFNGAVLEFIARADTGVALSSHDE